MIYNALLKTDLKPIKPYGAYYMMTNCKDFMDKHNIKNSLELAHYLIKEIGIATVPGLAFYPDEDDNIDARFQTRFCFCKKEETLRKAIERLESISVK